MPRTDYTIRYAQFLDIEAMVTLLKDLFTIEDDFMIDNNKQRQGLESLLHDQPRSCISVAEYKGSVIGMCTVQINISTAEGGSSALVEDLIVHASMRKKGVGTALLNSAIEWALKKKCHRVQLLVDKRNTNALAFYAQRGLDVTNMICLKSNISHLNYATYSSINNCSEINTRR